MKVFDLKGNKIKEIENSNFDISFIDNYYDKKRKKNYIIARCSNSINSYDFNENKIYHKYYINNNDIMTYLTNGIIIYKQKKVKLIESNRDGNLRIWDFHSGEFLRKIKINDSGLLGVCLWNKNCLFAGCNGNNLQLIIS